MALRKVVRKDIIHKSQAAAKLYVYVPEFHLFQADRREDNYANFHPTQITNPVFLNPSDFADWQSMKKFAQRFKARQHGRFLVTPLNMAISDLSPALQQDSLFHCATIPEAAKPNILQWIYSEGLTKEWLFLQDDPEVVKFKHEIDTIIAQLHEKFLQ